MGMGVGLNTSHHEVIKMAQIAYSATRPAGVSVIIDGQECILKYEKRKNGKVWIRVHWNITECTIEDQPNYKWNEWIISWVPTPTFEKEGVTIATKVKDENGNVDEDATEANILDYILLNAVEIVGYAQDAHDL